MKFTYDNAFQGAKITNGKTILYVYKVNAKSFYAGEITFPQFEERYENRPFKQTFKDLCKQNNFNMLSYGDYEISEEEAKKKSSSITLKSHDSIGKAEKLVISKIISEYEKKKKEIYCITIDVGKTTMRILKKNGSSVLLNINGDYYLYNIETSKTIKLGTVYDVTFTESTIPWENVA